eukprot:3677333-Pyramimonas_sp.AAC.1
MAAHSSRARPVSALQALTPLRTPRTTRPSRALHRQPARAPSGAEGGGPAIVLSFSTPSH